MQRLASLYLPTLPTDRIIGSEKRPESLKSSPAFAGEGDHAQHGGGAPSSSSSSALNPLTTGWRPGARWARESRPNALTLRQADGAMITARRDGNQNVVAAVCPAARALGLAPGMPLTKARILVTGLDVRDADEAGDLAWLTRLGLFAARRWTPRAAVSGPDGLWLDLTGVAHLFGGEARMCARILAFCRRLGFAARIAVAGTTGTAHALARFGSRPVTLCADHGEPDAIAAMPLAALRLDDRALGAARRLGLERIGELIAMPRAPLQRRFGAALLLRLDQALGRAPEPFDPLVPADPPSVLLRFQEPIATPEAIAAAAGEAVAQLVTILRKAGLGLRRLVLACDRVDNDVQSLTLGTARPTRDPVHLRRLICAKIENLEPGFGLETLRLTAVRVAPLGPQVIEGELAGTRPAPDLSLLVDRLAARLGARRLHRLGALESDLPERSVRRVGPLGAPAAWPAWPRPIRLLVPPEPVEQVLSALPDGPPRRFRWRGRLHSVRGRGDGPERVYGEWWRHTGEAEAVRDYFQVEDETGARFWLYRRGDGEDGRTGDLSWHMHGLFA